MKRPNVHDIRKEVQILTARSGGPGGQHVNKVETKVILKWSIGTSKVLSELEQAMIRAAHPSKISKSDEIIIAVDAKRSQLQNKEIAFKKLDRILAKAYSPKRKRRIPTQPTKAARRLRLLEKKKHGEKKAMRKRIL